MTLAELNALPRYRAEEEFLKCCGSPAWARSMARRRPFASFDRILQAASEIWPRLDPADWKQAFRAHPRIGQRQQSPCASSLAQAWSAQEQAGMSRAPVAVANALEEANQEYLAKFGYIFIVCATGKTAEEMLDLMRLRLNNSPEEEIRVASQEQDKITLLRLRKLLTA